MENLQIFNFKESEVRIILIDNQPHFVLKDICNILEIKNATDVAKRLDDDEVTRFNLGGLSGDSNVVNESGLYNVILRCDKPKAKPFRKWVTSEVLPQIRKTGSYGVPHSFSEALMLAAKQQEEIEKQELLLQTQKPKVEFFDQVASSSDAIEMATVAKTLNIKRLGRNKLFQILRDNKILRHNNQPYQEYCDRGYFRVVEQKYNVDGEIRISQKTLVYQKGVDYIRKLVTKEKI